jgi:hypothetical protein
MLFSELCNIPPKKSHCLSQKRRYGMVFADKKAVVRRLGCHYIRGLFGFDSR